MTTRLQLQLLGPFQASVEEHPLTDFATDKARALLVYLAMEPNIPHRRESLATLLFSEWGDQEAANNLRRTLYRLRAALNAHDPTLSDELLTVSRPTIQLNAGLLDLDAAYFRETVSQRLGATRLSESDLEALAAAATLYRGEFAAGLSVADASPFEEWLLLQRLAFHQQALYLCDVVTTAYEQRGQFVTAQNYARQALALEPWREEAHVQLIRLLASNRQDHEALAQFEWCRRVLAEEMGAEPGDEMLKLVAQIRKGEFQPAPLSATPMAPTRLHHFPATFTSFIGRDSELQTVVAHLLTPDCRVVTLLGAGGIGKTRLSIHTAQRLAHQHADDFTDGLYFVDCAPLSRAEDLPVTIALAVGLMLRGERPAIEQVHAFLRAKSLVLVLDNVEQIIECASDIATLLASCPQVKLLVTSREPLQIRAEWRYEVDGLDTAGGIESHAAHLFVQRARQVLPAFVPSLPEAQAITDIVNRVGGHPLAIELAATWLHFYDCATIANEIARGLDFLETTMRDIPARHRSIRVLFDHSWQRLSDAEQKNLRQLSVLRGEWTLAQASVVANGTPRTLAALSDKSLIRRTHAGRYAIDELIRQFAFEKLQSDTELSHVQVRSATFFLEGLTHHRAALYGMKPQNALAALRADWINIRYAWSHALLLQQWHLLEGAIEAYGMFVELTGLVTDGLTDFQEMLAASDADPVTVRLSAMAHAYIAGWFSKRAQYAQAHDHADAVLGLPERDDITPWRGVAWYVKAESLDAQGNDTATALAYAATAEGYFERAHDGWGKAKVAVLRATIGQKQGALAESLALYTDALTIFEHLAYPLGIIETLSKIGVLYRRRDEYEKALAYHLRSLALVQPLNSPAELARHHNNIGALYQNIREYEKAISHFSHALEIDERIGHQRGVAIEKGNLGLAHQQINRYDEALAYFADAVTIAQAIGLKGVEANFLGCRGELYADLGQFDRAKQELDQCVAVARAIQHSAIVNTYSPVLAWVYFRLGDSRQAFTLLEEVLADQLRLGLRERRAHTLTTKAQMLLEEGAYANALQSVEEAITVRTDIGLAPVALHLLRVLDAQLRAKLGQPETAIPMLNRFLDSSPDDEGRAEVLYALWDVTHDPRHQHAALALIETLYAAQPRHEYQLRLETLRTVLPQTT